jgi:hypothetical protein
MSYVKSFRGKTWRRGAADLGVNLEVLQTIKEGKRIEDHDVRGTSDQISRRFFLGVALVLLAIVELRALAKVGQLMARKIVLRFRVVFVG